MDTTGDCNFINNEETIQNITYIQLDSNQLKFPSIDINNNLSCNHFYLKNNLKSNIYKIKTPDDKILIADYKKNRLDFENNDDRIIKNSDYLIIVNGCNIFKAQIICLNKKENENINGNDVVCLKIFSVFTRKLCTNSCINQFIESKFKSTKFITVDENGNLQNADFISYFNVYIKNTNSNENLTYGDCSLKIIGHKNSFQTLFLPLILPLHLNF
jgi:hypothetical protein